MDNCYFDCHTKTNRRTYGVGRANSCQPDILEERQWHILTWWSS